MNEIEEIKNRIRISEFIGGYLPLKKAGRNYKGLCPFHNEKTPSLMVSDDKGIFHCFGCGEGGDAIAFYQKIEGIEFFEALKNLGERTGVKITSVKQDSKDRHDQLKKINELAAKYYNYVLNSPNGKTPKEYLISRGLNEKIIEGFLIGYSPINTSLFNWLSQKGFQEEELIASGIFFQKNGKFKDRFGGRITIPILDERGAFVGFTARTLKDEMPKYINTVETEIYKKSHILFGYSFAKSYIREKGQVIVVEGNMDVIALHQKGINYAVATSGTALTEDQVRIINRHSPKILLAFDSDEAGRKAIVRAFELFKNSKDLLYVLEYEGKDPAEAVEKDLKLFEKQIKNAKKAPVYYISFLLKEFENKKISKEQIISSFIEFIGLLGNMVERIDYIKTISETLAIPEQFLLDALEEKRNTLKNPRSMTSKKIIDASLKETDGLDALYRYLIELLLASNEIREYILRSLTDEEIPVGFKEILGVVRNLGEKYSFEDLLLKTPEAHKGLLIECAAKSEMLKISKAALRYEAVRVVKSVKKANILRIKKGLLKLIKEAEVDKNDQQIKSLIEKFNNTLLEEKGI